MTEKYRIPKTAVTYGQLEKALLSLGFTRSEVESNGASVVNYDHKKTGACIRLPSFPESDFVLDYHLAAVHSTLSDFGVADPSAFDAKLQKAG
jgi:hypothetical protein